ncbi:tRNA 2-selenouridine(34) synthase MnmH [Mesobacillus harenae]|uniref:tRNA 2-selenouridine(34) synthase MnmH n=1 Tax=Mesobacillus harenae TaxID=2213203 RepID=UPI001580E067|nr:tRNA 2-selenouridine(34) synthase MnmH [Mesobacillus harenae]
MQDITVEELVNNHSYVPVDVRSPGEYEEASIPGSINIPLFSNEERKEIGTLYKQKGTDSAKWRAMEIVSPKIPLILNQIKSLTEEGLQPVVHCWRGGMRSKSVASFTEFSGLPAVRLDGGYRAYRQYILDQIPKMLPQKAVILHGHTGTGKTDLLKVLEAKGYPVIDLERYANHRGSIFGTIGIGDGHNQKTFDALLFSRLREIKDSPYYIVEAESRRIGRVMQPEEMISRKLDGFHFLVSGTIENRIDRIYDEYVSPFKEEAWFREQVSEKTNRLQKRLKDQEQSSLLNQSVIDQDYKAVIRILLEHYYDPRYKHSFLEYKGSFTPINSDDMGEAIKRIEKELQMLNETMKLSLKK